MSVKSSFRAMISSGPIGMPTPIAGPEAALRLKALAVNGLVRMFDCEKQLFCHRLKRTEQGLVQEGISRRYTMIALLGLHQLEVEGTVSPIAIRPVLDMLLKNLQWVDSIGDLGLLLWLCALEAPEQQAEIDSCLKVESALQRFRDARQCSTMELAWFLSGLSHLSLANPEKRPDLRNPAVETYHRLRNNQGEFGIFGHVGTNESLAGMSRGRIGSFADQVYPIYAMTRFAQAFHQPKAIESALDCALTLCQAQGTLGQWWWHYDSQNGRVLEKYPVYSVHQDGIGPMALFALGEATQSDFSPWIYKGLQWLNGNNEMDFEMPDAGANVVWRSVARHSSKRYWNLAIDFLAQREDRAPRDALEVQFECRPCHFGWLLYAFPNRKNQCSSNEFGSSPEAADL